MTGEVEILPSEETTLLAYYDARQVSNAQLMRIFSCTAKDLASERETAEYQHALSQATLELVEQATDIDDGWNDLEKLAVNDLRGVMGAISDPRMLLGIAVQANKAGRRSGGLTPQQKPAEIHVPSEGGQTRVVRLRTKFVTQLSDPNGAARIAERQTEIEIAETNMTETLDPKDVKDMLREKLGVDPMQLHDRNHSGPDVFTSLTFDDKDMS